VFSLGAVLYTMLAGYHWTWDGDARRSVHVDPDIAQELRAILLTALEADPDRRFPSVGELRAVLAAHLEDIWPGRSW
jgi:hypothetical protein